MAFKLSVESFPEGGEIPGALTCDGSELSPVLHWQGEPQETKSFALIVDDPDAPGGTFTHWLLWNIPADIHSLAQTKRQAGTAGTNDFGKRGYSGPCPPRRGGMHRYFFRLFAIDTAELELREGAQRAVVQKAIEKHAIGETSYMGRYERH